MNTAALTVHTQVFYRKESTVLLCLLNVNHVHIRLISQEGESLEAFAPATQEAGDAGRDWVGQRKKLRGLQEPREWSDLAWQREAEGRTGCPGQCTVARGLQWAGRCHQEQKLVASALGPHPRRGPHRAARQGSTRTGPYIPSWLS